MSFTHSESAIHSDTAMSKSGLALNGTADHNSNIAEPLQIVTANINEEGARHFDLDMEAVESLLLCEKIRDKKVVVISVAGAFRKGKSFLLNFFLRYLSSQHKDECSGDSWVGPSDTPLKGFSWRGGSERDTTGILLWSEPYIVKQADGEEIVVLLMDTQGAFDSQSTVRDCATVFALSTMLSSVQIYNLSTNIQEDDLQHLQLFTEYGRLAQENNDSVPFQHLWFLIRDWSYPYEHGFGENGGESLLKKRLVISEKQHHELQQLRHHIKTCFEKISCYLLPHPGLDVATDPNFDGRVSLIHANFIAYIKQFVPTILSPKNLIVKKINGSEITCRELLEYFKVYIKIYQGDELPEPKSMLMATAEANNLAAVASSKTIYTDLMDEVCGGEKPYMSPDDLQTEHERCSALAVAHFEKLRKMGGPEFSAQYSEELRSNCEETFEFFRMHNQSKNVFVGARTPAVLFCLLTMAYLLAGFLDMIGLDPLANLLTWLLWIILIALSLWGYTRYSGKYLEVGHFIDNTANFLWYNALCPLYVKITQKAAEQAIGSQSGSTRSPFAQKCRHKKD